MRICAYGSVQRTPHSRLFNSQKNGIRGPYQRVSLIHPHGIHWVCRVISCINRNRKEQGTDDHQRSTPLPYYPLEDLSEFILPYDQESAASSNTTQYNTCSLFCLQGEFQIFEGRSLDTDPSFGRYWHFCSTIINVRTDRNPYERGV